MQLVDTLVTLLAGACLSLNISFSINFQTKLSEKFDQLGEILAFLDLGYRVAKHKIDIDFSKATKKEKTQMG